MRNLNPFSELCFCSLIGNIRDVATLTNVEWANVENVKAIKYSFISCLYSFIQLFYKPSIIRELRTGFSTDTVTIINE